MIIPKGIKNKENFNIKDVFEFAYNIDPFNKEKTVINEYIDKISFENFFFKRKSY